MARKSEKDGYEVKPATSINGDKTGSTWIDDDDDDIASNTYSL